MQLLAREFAERAERTPGDVAVIDALGVRTVGEVMAAARGLAIALEESLGGSPTVLVQADNTWRTLATALAVGLRGGMVAVFSSHAVAAEFELAMEDIEPDAVVAADDVLALLAGLAARRSPTSGPLSTAGPWSPPGAPPATSIAGRGGVAVAMTSGSTGRAKCVVQSEDVAAVRRPVDHRRDRASSPATPSAPSSRCRRSRRTASGCTSRPCSAARWCASTRGGPTTRWRAMAHPRRPLDDAGADDGAAALDPPDGAGPACRASRR